MPEPPYPPAAPRPKVGGESYGAQQQNSERPSKKERKALKRMEKEAMRKHERKKSKMKKLAIGVAVAVVAAGAIALFVLPASKGKAPGLGTDFSKEVAAEGRDHVSESTKVVYKSNPPTSGNHWPEPLQDGVYDKEKPDEAAVHSLEHGRIWISYKPSIPEQTKEALRKLLKGRAPIIVTPRSANETDIALVAWTRLDAFNLNPDGSFDEKRILDFIQRYKNKGPELIPEHAAGGKTYD